MKDLFFALIANFLELPILIRTLIIGCIIFFVLWPIIISLFKKILLFGIKITDICVIVCYWVYTNIIISSFQHIFKKSKSVSNMLVCLYNTSTNIIEAVYKRLKEISGKLKTNKKKYMKLSFILFIILYVLVAIPDLLSRHLNLIYLDKVSVVKKIYHNIEQFAFQDAYGAEPLFENENSFDYSNDNVSDNNESSVDNKLWLTVVKPSNMRKEPSLKAKVLTVLSTNSRVLYLNELTHAENIEWVKIQIDDGITGWISKKLINGLP